MPDYLAVKDWKDELKKHKVEKDGGLGDALTAWSKAKGKDAEEQAEALETVEAKAAAAEKLLKGNKDLLKFVSATATKAKEERRKVEAAAEDGGEDAAKDKVLYTALKRAKNARMFFAVVAKGTTDGHLILSKMKVKPTDIASAKKEAGGGRVFRGMCFGEDGKHIFELKKEPPPTLAKLLKKLAKLQSGLMIRAERRVAQLDEDLGDDPSDDQEELSDAAVSGTTAESTPTGSRKVGKGVEYAQLRLAWEGVRKQAAADVKQLQKAILEGYQGDQRMPRVVAAVKQIGAALDRFSGDLEDELDRALNAADDAVRGQHHDGARRIIAGYVEFLRTDPWLVKIDRNPFLPLKVQGPLVNVLESLDQSLSS